MAPFILFFSACLVAPRLAHLVFGGPAANVRIVRMSTSFRHFRTPNGPTDFPTLSAHPTMGTSNRGVEFKPPLESFTLADIVVARPTRRPPHPDPPRRFAYRAVANATIRRAYLCAEL